MNAHAKIDVDGVTLAYRVSGPDGAPPVILLHGAGNDGSTWDETAAALAGRYRVYVPDQRGHGVSDWPGDYSFELLRDDVVGFVRALGLGPVTLIGHSMGAIAAYMTAAAHPDLVSRLVLEEPPPPVPLGLPSLSSEAPGKDLGYDWELRVALRVRLNDPKPEWWDGLTGITAPTLMVVGGDTSHLPQDAIAAMGKRMANCRVVTVPAGHRVHGDAPGEFLGVVEEFLADG